MIVFANFSLFAAGLKAGGLNASRVKPCSFGGRKASRRPRPFNPSGWGFALSTNGEASLRQSVMLRSSQKIWCVESEGGVESGHALLTIDVSCHGRKTGGFQVRKRGSGSSAPPFTFSTPLSRQRLTTMPALEPLQRGKTWESKDSASRTVMRQRLGDWERIRSVQCAYVPKSSPYTEVQNTSIPAMGEVRRSLELSLPEASE